MTRDISQWQRAWLSTCKALGLIHSLRNKTRKKTFSQKKWPNSVRWQDYNIISILCYNCLHTSVPWGLWSSRAGWCWHCVVVHWLCSCGPHRYCMALWFLPGCTGSASFLLEQQERGPVLFRWSSISGSPHPLLHIDPAPSMPTAAISVLNLDPPPRGLG